MLLSRPMSKMLRTKPVLLVIDDSPDLAALFASWVSEFGDVHTATSSAQALVIASVVRPDLVISDIMLPRMTGFEIVGQLRQTTPDLRVIFVTAYFGMASTKRARELGAAAILPKPVERETLQFVVQSTLSGVGDPGR